MARAATQPVRLRSDLISKLKAHAQQTGRSLPAEVEARLQDSLQRGAWADIEPRLTPRARVLGWLIAFLANELGAYSPPAEQAEYLKVGIARILERLNAPEKHAAPEHDAAMMADNWWLRIVNAHERSYEGKVAIPDTPESKALLQIHEALLSTEPATGPAHRPRKERK